MLAQLIGAGLGAGFNAFNAYEQSKKEKELLRIEEDYNRMGNAEIERAKERNALLNPQATAQRARQDVSATQSAAVGQALNAAAGQSASSGDFGNAQAAAIQGSQAAQAAAAPYAQQNAAIAQQAQEAEQNRIRQSESLGQTQANLSQNVTYLEREKNNINPLASALQVGFGSLVGGANVASSLLGLANDKDTNVNPTTQQNGMVVPNLTQKQVAMGSMGIEQNNAMPDMSFENSVEQTPYGNMFQEAPEAAGPYNPTSTQMGMKAGAMPPAMSMAMAMQRGFAPVQRFMKPKPNF
jgi:hypothetical protein